MWTGAARPYQFEIASYAPDTYIIHTYMQMTNDKSEAAFTGHARAPCLLSRDLWASADSLLEPGQVLTGAPTVTPTVVWAPEVPPGPQRHMLQPVVLPPPAEARYSFILLSRETNVSEFLAHGNYTKAPVTET